MAGSVAGWSGRAVVRASGVGASAPASALLVTKTVTSKKGVATKIMHHLLDMALLPDELYSPDVPTEKWLDRVEKQAEFPAGSLSRTSWCHPKAEAERLIGVPLYLMLNWLPFLLPVMSWALRGWRGLVVLAIMLGALSLKPVPKP